MLSTTDVSRKLKKLSPQPLVEAKIPNYEVEYEPVMVPGDAKLEREAKQRGTIRASFSTQSKVYMLSSNNTLEVWNANSLELINKVALPMTTDATPANAWDSLFVFGHYLLLNMGYKAITAIVDTRTMEKIAEIPNSHLDLTTAQSLDESHFLCQQRGGKPIGVYALKEGKDKKPELNHVVSLDVREQLYRKQFALTADGKLIHGGLTRDTKQLKLEVWGRNDRGQFAYEKVIALPVAIPGHRFTMDDAIDTPDLVPSFSLHPISDQRVGVSLNHRGNIIGLQVLNIDTGKTDPISDLPLVHPPLRLMPNSAFAVALEAKNSRNLIVVDLHQKTFNPIKTRTGIRSLVALSDERVLVDTRSHGRKLLTLDPLGPDPLAVKQKLLEEPKLYSPLADIMLSYMFRERKLPFIRSKAGNEVLEFKPMTSNLTDLDTSEEPASPTTTVENATQASLKVMAFS